MTAAELVVERVGPLATVQDLGRPGYAALGVTTSGAADRPALRLANRLLGNPENAPGLEVLIGGLSVRAAAAVTVAVTGAAVPLTVGAASAPLFAPVRLSAGDVLAMGRPAGGLRSYLAVRGGLLVKRVFGSCSTDLVAGLGPAAVAPGTRLIVDTQPTTPIPGADVAACRGPAPGAVLLRAIPGPRDDWFDRRALSILTDTAWTVGADSDRVGVRLTGPRLRRERSEELPSEGVIRGSIQVPASGQPLVFFADHPTTGGYPVIAVVIDADVDQLAQAAPGTCIRFQLKPPTL